MLSVGSMASAGHQHFVWCLQSFEIRTHRWGYVYILSVHRLLLSKTWYHNKISTEVTLGFNRTPPEHTVRGLRHKTGPKNTLACGVSGAAGSTVAWASRPVSFFGMLWDNMWDMISDLMGFYSDLMGFIVIYSDLMGFYSDSMGY